MSNDKAFVLEQEYETIIITPSLCTHDELLLLLLYLLQASLSFELGQLMSLRHIFIYLIITNAASF